MQLLDAPTLSLDDIPVEYGASSMTAVMLVGKLRSLLVEISDQIEIHSLKVETNRNE